MRDIAKQGIYRIIYDIVKADSIITVHEIEYMKKLCDKYDLNPDLRSEALNLTLSEAISEVRNLPYRQSLEFIKEMEELSISDGACCREEALILTAIYSCMGNNRNAESEVISVPCGNVMFNNSQVLFIENGYDAKVNEYIENHFSHILNSLLVGGFDFVYVPEVIKQLSSTGNKLLDNIVYYLAPTKNNEETKGITKAITGLTSEKLYRELLLGKLGFDVDIIKPSIVIRIGFSIVNGIRMANYLFIPLADNICQQIDSMINKFLALQKSPTLIIKNNVVTPNVFVYTGFYRTLFDLITYRQGAQCDLIVHPYAHKTVLSIKTTFVDKVTECALNIAPKEAAFYVFLINETIDHNGFNIAGTTNEDILYLNEAQKRFQKIYFSLCNREIAPDITNSDIRRPMLSKIKKALENHPHLIQKMMFLPEINKHKVIKVHVEKKHLIIIENK